MQIVRNIEKEEGQRRSPWSFALFRLLPVSPSVMGALFGLLSAGLLVAFELMSGRPQKLLAGMPPEDVGCVFLLGDYRIALIGVILLAYTMTARYILTLWSQSAGRQLLKEDFQDAESIAESRWWGFLPGLAGAALTLTFGIDISERPMEWNRAYWILPHTFNWLWTIPFGWVAGRFFYSVPVNAILVARRAREIGAEELDSTLPMEQTIRHGLRSALLSLVFLGLVSVHFVDPGVGIVAVGVLVALFVSGVAIAIVPVANSFREVKAIHDQRLETLQAEIAAEERKLMERASDYEPGRIRDLTALEKRMTEQRFNFVSLPNVLRLAMYAFVGLLSWLGAAAVSIALEQVFGV